MPASHQHTSCQGLFFSVSAPPFLLQLRPSRKGIRCNGRCYGRARGRQDIHRLSRPLPSRSRSRRSALRSRLSSSPLTEDLVRQWRFFYFSPAGACKFPCHHTLYICSFCADVDRCSRPHNLCTCSFVAGVHRDLVPRLLYTGSLRDGARRYSWACTPCTAPSGSCAGAGRCTPCIAPACACARKRSTHCSLCTVS